MSSARAALRLALADGLALLVVFVGAKVYLAFTLVHAGQHPFDEMGLARAPFLFGADCLTAAAAVVLAFGARMLSRVAAWVLQLALVVLTAMNVKVSQVYGQPISFDLLSYVSDLSVMKDSVLASVDAGVLGTALGGVAALVAFHSPPFLRRWPFRERVVVPALAVLAAAVVFSGLSLHVLRGLYDHGLKSNAPVALLRTYQRHRAREDYPQMRAELAKALAPTGGSTLRWAPVLGNAAPAPGLPALAGRAKDYNVLFVLLESTGARFIDEKTSPNLARLRQHALVLDDYFTTAPFTFDAQYGIFYSEYVRATSMDIARAYGTPPKDTSLAEVLHAAGYRTGLFHSSFIHFMDMLWQFKGKGFDAITSADDLVSPSHPGWSWGAREEDTVAAAVQWLDANKSSKFFLVYNTVTPHHPYHAPLETRPFPGTSLFDNYRNAVFYTDRNVGALLAALERAGVASHTLIVVTSDHGETADAEALGGGHGIRFSTDELRVPMFFASEVLFPEPVHSALPANHLDFAPTLSALLGTPPVEGALGRNLLAPEVTPRLLYVERGVGSYAGLVDGDEAYALNVSDGLKRLYRVTPSGFEPVKPNAAETSALETYAREVAAFDDRVMLRHLERAGR